MTIARNIQIAMATIYFIGVDVGTASVRAGLFDYNGKLVRCSTSSIQIWNPAPNHYEQSSDDIWSSCCQVVKVYKLVTFSKCNFLKLSFV